MRVRYCGFPLYDWFFLVFLSLFSLFSFTRHAVFLAMGRSKSALPDLDKVITMKPDFVSARLQRGNIHLKQGTFEEARRDFEDVLKLAPDNEEALGKLEEVQPLEEAFNEAETLLRFDDYVQKIL